VLQEANKALIHLLFEEVIQGGNLAKVDDIFSADFVDHSTPDQRAGREGVKGYLLMVRTGFPDLHVTLDDVIAAGDRVVVRSTWRGTHLGIYGIAPTGKSVARTMIQIFRNVDGVIVEEWNEGGNLLDSARKDSS
jgi:predicted ester cyclase